jgi:hypothetical protein
MPTDRRENAFNAELPICTPATGSSRNPTRRRACSKPRPGSALMANKYE